MGRLLVFLAALFAMGFTGHAQDDPGALRGVYGSSQAVPAPAATKRLGGFCSARSARSLCAR
jgi:hypothetical protein